MSKALSFTHELSFLYFYQYTALSGPSVDGHQMYSGGKTSTIGPEISPTAPLIFTGVKKCEIWRGCQHHSTSSFENAARYPNAETNLFCRHDRPMPRPSLVKLGPRTPENRSVKVRHPQKLHGENVLNRQ